MVSIPTHLDAFQRQLTPFNSTPISSLVRNDPQFRPTPAATDGAPPRPPARLIGRHTEDPSIAHWKGYRGGAGGEVWLDVEGVGDFKARSIHWFPYDPVGVVNADP
jgi:hypothetical protein